MSAGESARDEARRSREKAERLAHRAEMFERGAVGEERTAQVLAGLGPDWVSLHDHRWPGRRLANIDHVVVGPGGIFVIDSKNWTGDLRVDGQTLRQNGRAREKSVAGAADAALAVSELVAPYAHVTRPVLCFTRDDDLAGWVRDVMVCSTANLAAMLTSREPILDRAQVADAATRLDIELRAAVTREAEIHAPTARGTSSSPKGAKPHPPSRAAARNRSSTKGPSPARLAGFLAATLALYVGINTVLPHIADAVGEAVVGVVDSEPPGCETTGAKGNATTGPKQASPTGCE